MNTFPKPPLILQSHFFSQWNILKPTVYRYMPSQFINEFFSHGKIRLSSLKKFAEHPNEMLRDEHEGRFIHETKTDKALILALVDDYASNSYVLCGSTLYSEQNFETFDATECIAIHDTLNFSNAISRYINGFIGGAEGFAIYQDDPIIRQKIVSTQIDEYIENIKYNKEINKAPLQQLNENTPPELFQLVRASAAFKKSTKYAHEFEYRMIWNTEKIALPYIDIEVPNAIQFCERMKISKK